MSKLLLDEHPIMVQPALAKAIGLPEAIILQQIHYWLVTTPTTSKNTHHGKKWIFNTLEAWQAQFPFWSKNTIHRTSKSLQALGLVLTGNFNRRKSDRTIWYTIQYEKLQEIEHSIHLPKIENPFTQNGDMDVPKIENPFTQNGTTLPETTQEIKTKTKTEKPAASPDVKVLLDFIYELYEGKVNTTRLYSKASRAEAKAAIDVFPVESLKLGLEWGKADARFWAKQIIYPASLMSLMRAYDTREMKQSKPTSNLPDPSLPRQFDENGYEVKR
jgi:hypothetical protein